MRKLTPGEGLILALVMGLLIWFVIISGAHGLWRLVFE